MGKNNLPIEVRDIRNSHWYWISRLVYEKYAHRIGVTGLALYNAYASYAREKGSAFPSQGTIAKILNISIPTINKYNKILEENKLIKIDSGKRRGTSNITYLLKVKGIKQFKTSSKRTLDRGIKRVKTKEKHIERKENKDTQQGEWIKKYGNRIPNLIDKYNFNQLNNAIKITEAKIRRGEKVDNHIAYITALCRAGAKWEDTKEAKAEKDFRELGEKTKCLLKECK